MNKEIKQKVIEDFKNLKLNNYENAESIMSAVAEFDRNHQDKLNELGIYFEDEFKERIGAVDKDRDKTISSNREEIMKKNKRQLQLFDDNLEVKYTAIHTKHHYDEYGNLICEYFLHEFTPIGI